MHITGIKEIHLMWYLNALPKVCLDVLKTIMDATKEAYLMFLLTQKLNGWIEVQTSECTALNVHSIWQ